MKRIALYLLFFFALTSLAKGDALADFVENYWQTLTPEAQDQLLNLYRKSYPIDQMLAEADPPQLHATLLRTAITNFAKGMATSHDLSQVEPAKISRAISVFLDQVRIKEKSKELKLNAKEKEKLNFQKAKNTVESLGFAGMPELVDAWKRHLVPKTLSVQELNVVLDNLKDKFLEVTRPFDIGIGQSGILWESLLNTVLGAGGAEKVAAYLAINHPQFSDVFPEARPKKGKGMDAFRVYFAEYGANQAQKNVLNYIFTNPQPLTFAAALEEVVRAQWFPESLLGAANVTSTPSQPQMATLDEIAADTTTENYAAVARAMPQLPAWMQANYLVQSKDRQRSFVADPDVVLTNYLRELNKKTKQYAVDDFIDACAVRTPAAEKWHSAFDWLAKHVDTLMHEVVTFMIRQFLPFSPGGARFGKVGGANEYFAKVLAEKLSTMRYDQQRNFIDTFLKSGVQYKADQIRSNSALPALAALIENTLRHLYKINPAHTRELLTSYSAIYGPALEFELTRDLAVVDTNDFRHSLASSSEQRERMLKTWTQILNEEPVAVKKALSKKASVFLGHIDDGSPAQLALANAWWAVFAEDPHYSDESLAAYSEKFGPNLEIELYERDGALETSEVHELLRTGRSKVLRTLAVTALGEKLKGLSGDPAKRRDLLVAVVNNIDAIPLRPDPLDLEIQTAIDELAKSEPKSAYEIAKVYSQGADRNPTFALQYDPDPDHLLKTILAMTRTELQQACQQNRGLFYKIAHLGMAYEDLRLTVFRLMADRHLFGENFLDFQYYYMQELAEKGFVRSEIVIAQLAARKAEADFHDVVPLMDRGQEIIPRQIVGENRLISIKMAGDASFMQHLQELDRYERRFLAENHVLTLQRLESIAESRADLRLAAFRLLAEKDLWHPMELKSAYYDIQKVAALGFPAADRGFAQSIAQRAEVDFADVPMLIETHSRQVSIGDDEETQKVNAQKEAARLHKVQCRDTLETVVTGVFMGTALAAAGGGALYIANDVSLHVRHRPLTDWRTDKSIIEKNIQRDGYYKNVFEDPKAAKDFYYEKHDDSISVFSRQSDRIVLILEPEGGAAYAEKLLQKLGVKENR